MKNPMWINMPLEVVSIFSMYAFIWLMFCFVTVKTRADFQLNLDTYSGRSPLYFLQLFIWIFFDSHDHQEKSQVSLEQQILFILLYQSTTD